jgi:hypothetical protein
MQPVWMVINLQGKIKGSYTAEKMLEFCRRGTLGGAQLVLGMDRNLPYNARQVSQRHLDLNRLPAVPTSCWEAHWPCAKRQWRT